MAGNAGERVKAAKLDDLGRCCGRKPIVYKRDGFRFCPKCDRAYSLDHDRQITNWRFRVEEATP